MKRKSIGFSMIELLVVIGVIVILVGLLILGINAITGNTEANSATVDVKNAENLLTELEANASLSGLLQGFYNVGTLTWSGNQGVIAPAGQVAPLPPTVSDFTIVKSAQVFNKMRSVPNVRDAMGKLPSTKLATRNFSAGTITLNNATVLVDPKGAPVLFVPPSGLVVATAYSGAASYQPGNVVISGSNYYKCLQSNSGQAVSSTQYWQQVSSDLGIIKAPNGRPFFAAPGPDSDFLTTDDNVYSFEK